MYKIKISLVKDNQEVDYIQRDIPIYRKYSIITGILIDLNLLIYRNFVKYSPFFTAEGKGEYEYIAEDTTLIEIFRNLEV